LGSPVPVLDLKVKLDKSVIRLILGIHFFSLISSLLIWSLIGLALKIIKLRSTCLTFKLKTGVGRVAVLSAKNHKRQRRKRQSVAAKREKSQTPKVLTAILTLPNLTQPNLT